jgi:imidazolonepropionase-like amidohydrolase
VSPGPPRPDPSEPPWDLSRSKVALVGARLIDGTGLPPVDDAVVVLDHGRLAAVGPRARVPAGAAIVDLQGATLCPGVVDAHVHLAFAGDPTRLVRGGVTAVRDLGWPPDLLRPLAEAAWAAGLLVHAVGPILTAPDGYPTRAAWAPPGTARVVTGIDDGVRAVDEVMALGATAVKVGLDDRWGPLLAPATLAAIVTRALEWGRIVTAHVGSADALALAVDAGVGELAHVPFSTKAVPDDLVDRAVAAGLRLVPTMHCRDGDPGEERAAALAFLRRWIALGGEVAYGTDLGNAGTEPGIDRRELAVLAEAGMTPAEIVVAATSRAAHAIGAWDLTGRVAPGLRADLLVLDGDPLADAAALADPRWVIAAGRPVAW